MRGRTGWRFVGMVLAVAVGVGLAGDGTGGAGARAGQKGQAGAKIVLELDNEFIEKYENRATIESEFKIAGLSSVHKPEKDGEVHIGGWSYEGGMACVAEVMNAANTGGDARQAFLKAKNAGQKVTAAGAWRLWCEHGGTTAQIQAKGTEPEFPLPGTYASNPDHVFEIHPVTWVKVGDKVTDATKSIGETKGHTPHDPRKAFLGEYENLSCTIVPKAGNRTRLLIGPAQFNFTEFVIVLGENPFQLDDGHGVICSVHEDDGDQLVRNRRMVFIKDTAADEEVKGAKKGDRFRVIGMPRISLKLVKWRLAYKDDPDYDESPLKWGLPYEMIIVHAEKLDDD